jgi:hypothetical protein
VVRVSSGNSGGRRCIHRPRPGTGRHTVSGERGAGGERAGQEVPIIGATDRQPGVHQLTPSAPLHLSAALLGTFVLASCGAVASIVDPVPCWQERIEFNFRPVTVEGILQVDEEASGMFIRLSDGREYDIGFPDGFRVIIGPGVGGHVDSPHGGTIAEAGDSISLWGGDTHVGEEPRPPASPGRRGLIVCAINGQQVRDANGATIGQ